jgi:hypothetical protein
MNESLKIPFQSILHIFKFIIPMSTCSEATAELYTCTMKASGSCVTLPVCKVGEKLSGAIDKNCFKSISGAT